MFNLISKSLINNITSLLRKPLIKNIFLIGFVSILVKIVGFYKETVVASFFGLSESLDTFYIAILIPSFIQNVFIISLKHLFIPNYITELNTTNQRGNFQTFSLLLITGIVVLLTLMSIVFSEYFLETVFPGHHKDYYSSIRIQLYWVLPCLFFWGYTGFLNGLQEIKNKYLASTISSIFMPIVAIICLIYFQDELGDNVLAIGLLLGSFASFLYTLITSLLHKVIFIGFIKINDNMKIMLQQYPAKATSGLLTGLNPFVDQFFAAQLAIGSIAAINYGKKIPAFIVGILIMAIGNVLLPHFSRQINSNPKLAYSQLFRILKTVFLIGIIITMINILFSHDIIQILFERNEFTADNTNVVSKIQQIAFAHVPFYLCTLICVKFLTAINKNKFMAWTSFWNLFVNLIMNVILMKYYGVYGLVLSTTIVYIVASFIYVGFTYRLYQNYLNENN